MLWLQIACVALALTVVALTVKIIIMRRSMHEICTQMEEYLLSNTNQTVTVSSADKYVRYLAIEINRQLVELRRQRQLYEQGDRELKDAVANISHDLRTPLTAICGYLELLGQADHSEEVARYLAQIQNRTEAMRALTEEMFRYSVLSSERSFEIEKVDLCRTLEDSLLSFYGLLKQKEIEPQVTIPDTAVYRMLDPALLARILENILSNAVRYSDGDLRVSLDENGCFTFSNRAKRLSIVDVERLFDRFYTVDCARKTTGLGLSIAKLLTERMGGSVAARYADGRLMITLEF